MANPHFFRNASLLSLLALQVGVQPVLVKWYAKDTNDIRVRVAVIEGIKFVVAIVNMAIQGSLIFEIQQWEFALAVKTTLLPSLIYVVQNYLNQSAVVLLDGVTFNILNQTKIIWAAILLYIMLQKHQSVQQIGALIILILGALCMTLAPHKTSTSSSKSTDAYYMTGVCQALIAAVLSAFAGTIIQKALQSHQRNAYLVTIELSVFGLLSLFLSSFVHETNNTQQGIWHGWTLMTFFTMTIQALGGIVVGFVVKYTGTIEKSFAVVAGLVLTAIIESHYNDAPFGFNGVLSILLVATSTYVYTKYPYVPPSVPAVSPTQKALV